jgi:hypothetical protein
VTASDDQAAKIWKIDEAGRITKPITILLGVLADW